MPPLPPLECLRFFDAAAYRVKMLESHLGHSLFDRTQRGVTLNPSGQTCWLEVQRILSDIQDVFDRYRSSPQPRRVSVVAVESVAERWLMPKIVGFNEVRPDIAIELETGPPQRRLQPPRLRHLDHLWRWDQCTERADDPPGNAVRGYVAAGLQSGAVRDPWPAPDRLSRELRPVVRSNVLRYSPIHKQLR